jgi:hypothetical protein
MDISSVLRTARPSVSVPLSPRNPPRSRRVSLTHLGPWVRCYSARRARLLARSQGNEEDPNIRSSEALPALTLEEAYHVLGLQVGSSYDDVLAKKTELLEECDASGDNQEKALLVECANDIILSSNLKARLSGDLKVSTSVRYADVQKPGSNFNQTKTKRTVDRVASKIQRVPQMAGNLVSVEPLRGRQAATVSAVFGSLLLWDVLQGVYTSGGQIESVPGAQPALAFAALVYFERERRVDLGRSFAIALLGLIAGSLLGSVLESYLQVDIVPFLGIDSPAVIVSSGAVLVLWACAMLLA